MQTNMTIIYDLCPQDVPLVVVLDGDGEASLHYMAWSGMPLGFSIRFTREHLPFLRELCEKLAVDKIVG